MNLPSWFKVGLNFTSKHIPNNLYCVINNIWQLTCDVTVVNATHKFDELGWNLEHTIWGFENKDYTIVRDSYHNILYFRHFMKGDCVKTDFGVAIVQEDEPTITSERQLWCNPIKIKSKFQKHDEVMEIPRGYIFRISEHEYVGFEKSNQKNTIIHQRK